MSDAKLASREKKKEPHRFMYNGKVAEPAKYLGRHTGEGRFMATVLDGELLYDDNGRPVRWSAFLLEKLSKTH